MFYWLALSSSLNNSTSTRRVSAIVDKLYYGRYHSSWSDHIIISKSNNEATQLCIDSIGSSTLYRTVFNGEAGVETFHSSSIYITGSYYYTYYAYLYSGKSKSTINTLGTYYFHMMYMYADYCRVDSMYRFGKLDTFLQQLACLTD